MVAGPPKDDVVFCSVVLGIGYRVDSQQSTWIIGHRDHGVTYSHLQRADRSLEQLPRSMLSLSREEILNEATLQTYEVKGFPVNLSGLRPNPAGICPGYGSLTLGGVRGLARITQSEGPWTIELHTVWDCKYHLVRVTK
jgi:hypothetical protein